MRARLPCCFDFGGGVPHIPPPRILASTATHSTCSSLSKLILMSSSMMFEERAIEILAYSLETVLAEKLETVISRATTNTRMRDFYDLHILCQLYGGTLTARVLADALCATARRRGTLRLLSEAEDVLRELADDPHMRKLWDTYRARYSYASELTWDIVLSSVRQLCITAGLVVEPPKVSLTPPHRKERER